LTKRPNATSYVLVLCNFLFSKSLILFSRSEKLNNPCTMITLCLDKWTGKFGVGWN